MTMFTPRPWGTPWSCDMPGAAMCALGGGAEAVGSS